MLVMSSVSKERAAIIAITALLLWSWGPEPAHIAAAVAAVLFFCWFVGVRRPGKIAGDEEPHA